MKKICRTCKYKEECNIDREKRQKAWDGAWDSWICGNYKETDTVQLLLDDFFDNVTLGLKL